MRFCFSRLNCQSPLFGPAFEVALRKSRWIMVETDCASRRRRQINIWLICFMLRLEEDMRESRELGPWLLYLGKYCPVMLLFCYFLISHGALLLTFRHHFAHIQKSLSDLEGEVAHDLTFRLCLDLCLHICYWLPAASQLTQQG